MAGLGVEEEMVATGTARKGMRAEDGFTVARSVHTQHVEDR